LNNILDFSSVESGQLILAEVPFSLRDTLAEVLGPLALRAHEEDLELLYELDPELPDMLIGDPARLSQIVHNLVDNAIKFSDEGRITVRAFLRQIDGNETTLRFDVVDTGLGIDPSQLGPIRSGFTQADSSSTRRHGGAGLGLTISSQLAVLMGGRLDIKSEPGRGSTFSVTCKFPLAHKPRLHSLPSGLDAAVPPAASESLSVTGSHPRSLHILVAEDNPVSQRMLKGALERCGHLVELVENGKDAVERAASSRFDMVFMDIEMPVLDGFGATALIRQQEDDTSDRVPIVAMIRHGVVPDAQRFRRAGMDHLLSKPIDTEKLEALLEALPVDSVLASVVETDASDDSDPGTPRVDNELLLQQAGGDPRLAAELVATFIEERATILEPIIGAIEERDADRLEQAAQQLSGTFGALAALRATEAARRLERMGRVGDLGQAANALSALKSEVILLEGELQSFVEQVS
jgi:CheY-like chemotaxis protein